MKFTWSFVLGAALAANSAWAAEPKLTPCRVVGIKNEVQCGSIKRALNPAEPAGTQIDVHFVVVPAMARNKQPDPLFFFAGGPGQSAITIAPQITGLFGRVNNRRDLVFIDQRGTGKSAPLACKPKKGDAFRPLAELMSTDVALRVLNDCLTELQKLPYGDLRHFHTAVAMQDADAVRTALGYSTINIAGGSYGTRAVLDYLRQFPTTVRRAILDGVAPPDSVLPASVSTDSQAATELMFDACAADVRCNARYPNLRATWKQLLAGLPKTASVINPGSGLPENVTVSAETVVGAVRSPLYVPAIASTLPYAISEAAAGRFTPLVGASNALSGAVGDGMAAGMHFAVVCSEDFPRMALSKDTPGADFAGQFAKLYQGVCSRIPKGAVPPAFYTMPTTTAATLIMSGGADPVTPPRHGERAGKALGAKARHVVVPQAGHGVMGIGCVRDVMFRFINAESDDEALKADMACVKNIPRPTVFIPVAGSQP
jgi:pimeloyl-ACP methyl ester carboxylesterase